MSLVVLFSLFVVCCLYVVGCSLFVVRCALFVVACSLFVGVSSLAVLCCVWFSCLVGSYVLFVVYCVGVVCCLLPVVDYWMLFVMC